MADRVTEALQWVVGIKADYPAMIEIDYNDAQSHLDEIDRLTQQNADMAAWINAQQEGV